MSDTRRGAVRLAHGDAGFLVFEGQAVKCVVVDLSVTGARVRLLRPRPIPDEVTLETDLAGESIAVPGRVRRGEPGRLIALEFDGEDTGELARLIAVAERIASDAGRRTTVERRRTER
jgi:hypothetical protein